jgi:hypothetical protein
VLKKSLFGGGINSRPYEQQRLIIHRAGHSALPIEFFNSSFRLRRCRLKLICPFGPMGGQMTCGYPDVKIIISFALGKKLVKWTIKKRRLQLAELVLRETEGLALASLKSPQKFLIESSPKLHSKASEILDFLKGIM